MDNFLLKYRGQTESVTSIIDITKDRAKKIEEKSLINHKAKEFNEKFEDDFQSLMYHNNQFIVNYQKNDLKQLNQEIEFQNL